jgi:hypothetical protein
MLFKFPKLSPESIMILPLAVSIDLAGIIIVLFGLDDFGILDIIGICTIGAWQIFKAGKMRAPKTKKGGFLEKVFTGKWSRFFVTWGGELIPYVGWLPFWTLAVYNQLMHQEEQ